MTDQKNPPLTEGVRRAIERIAEENGFALVRKSRPDAPHAKLAEMPDGTYEMLDPGTEAPREAKSIKRVWFGPVEGFNVAEIKGGAVFLPQDRVTSPEVAALAAKGLADPASLTPEEIQSVCASAVAQA